VIVIESARQTAKSGGQTAQQRLWINQMNDRYNGAPHAVVQEDRVKLNAVATMKPDPKTISSIRFRFICSLIR
jgi:hypothetical protein